MAVRRVEGTHRNEALAERHLRQLERENPNTTVDIVARRNFAGRYSVRGHFFTFQIKDKAPQKEVGSLNEFENIYDEAEEFEQEAEWEGRPEYGDE